CLLDMLTRAATSTLFPYTTLFRSRKYCLVCCHMPVKTGEAGHHRQVRVRHEVRGALREARVFLTLGAPSAPFQPSEERCPPATIDRKSTRLNSSHVKISYAVFCLK